MLHVNDPGSYWFSRVAQQIANVASMSKCIAYIEGQACLKLGERSRFRALIGPTSRIFGCLYKLPEVFVSFAALLLCA